MTFCYKYVTNLQKSAAGTTVHGLDPEQAWEGAVAFVLLHETSHALFDLLKVSARASCSGYGSPT